MAERTVTYFQLVLPIVAIISITKLIPYFRTHYIEREWDIAYGALSDKTRDKFKNQCDGLNVIIGLCYFCGIYPAILYFNKPYVVYSAYKVVVVSGLFMAFEDDRLIWRITMGNRISIDTAHRLYYKVALSEVDVLDIRYFLCDSLRKRDMKLGNVKSLLEVYPNYMNLYDRDGMDPFELACRFASADIVQYMVELDEKRISYVDRRGNTPLHWACQRKPYIPNLSLCSFHDNPSLGRFQGLDVVNYLLEKRMSLVMVANKDGDLPIHLASYRMESPHPNRVGGTDRDYMRSKWNWMMSEPERIEIVLRLLLAYPDCLNCVRGSTSGSSGKDIDNKKNRKTTEGLNDESDLKNKKNR